MRRPSYAYTSPQTDGNAYTLHKSPSSPLRLRLHLHLPRKRMETRQVLDLPRTCLLELRLHLPRKGMET